MAGVLKTRFHTGVLARLYPRTAASVKREVQGENIWKDNDWISFNIASLPYQIEQELRKALVECEKQPEYAQPVQPAKPDTSLQEHEAYMKKVNEDIAKQSEILRKQKALEESGHEQMRLYTAAGLADTRRNSDLITEHIRNNGGVFCAVTVRAAVEANRANLDWVKVAPPQPSQTQTEPSTVLSDGSRQLPLGTTPARHHTIAQLRDLDARERKARGRQQGTFGSKF